MNTTILHRLAWKEFRTLRPLWLSLLAVAAVLQVGLVWLFDRQHWFNNGVPFYPRAAWLVGVLAALPAMFAAVSLAMSFAGERDDGTDQFLCRLAPPPLKLLGVKVGLCVAGAFAMFVLLVPLTIVIDLLAVPRDLYTLQVDPLDQKTRWESAARLAKFHPELTVIFQSIRDTERESFIRTSWVLNGLLCGIFFSLLFRGVLSCLIGTTVTLSVAWLVRCLQGANSVTPSGH